MMFKFFTAVILGISTIFSGVASHTSQIVSQVTGHGGATSAQVTYTQDQLLSMAGNIYADGNLPLGDNKYVTTGAKKGYVYLCHANADPNGGGAQKAGTWIHASIWNIKEKSVVQGNVNWPSATFSNLLSGENRTLSGNDLPTHTTGVFPITSKDPAYVYDKNPNSIKAQSFSDTLPANPTYSDTPYCMGGEAGIMTTGVALFNGFDAGLRDAAAYEVQDSCQGHPQVTGEYHYHSLSSCITDVSETTVIGYALDGFPITGPKVADGKYLTTDNLDVCHGLTSEIVMDGKQVTMYHYVMTQDFPYSVSCFRGKPVSYQVVSSSKQIQQSNKPSGQQGQNRPVPNSTQGLNSQNHQPPQEALPACSGKTSGASCSFTSPNGTVSGTCNTPPGQTTLVCIPPRVSMPPGQPMQQ